MNGLGRPEVQLMLVFTPYSGPMNWPLVMLGTLVLWVIVRMLELREGLKRQRLSRGPGPVNSLDGL